MKLFFGAGLNENQYPTPHEASLDSQNFVLQQDASHLAPRPAFDLKGTVPNAGDVRGFLQLVKRDGTETTLVQAGNAVYLWNGASSFTQVSSCWPSSQLRGAYWSLDDYLIVADLARSTPVSTWNGTSFAALATGLAFDIYAKYVLVHQGRVWLFNIFNGPGGADHEQLAHMILVSAFEDPNSWDTTKRVQDQTFTSGEEAFYILTPDLRAINGVAEFHGDIIISTTDGKLFKLTGIDSTTYALEEYYAGSAAIGVESMVETGNDIVYMRTGGAIDSLRTTDKYGDTAVDDLSRWIPETVKNLQGAIAVYEQQRQRVLFFVLGKVLVLYKDILLGGSVINDQGGKQQGLSPWSVFTTRDPGQFNTSAAKYMLEPGTDTRNVYFGSSDGRIFTLNGSGQGDAGSHDIRLTRTTRFLDASDTKLPMERHSMKGRVRYRRIAAVDVTITLEWADDFNASSATVPLKGPPVDDVGVFYGHSVYYGGDFYYNHGFEFSRKIAHQDVSWVGKGEGCTVTVTSLDTQQYQIEHIELK